MNTPRILIDTGPLVALLNRHDAHHEACDEAAKSLRLPLLACWPVITEAAYLLRRSPDAVQSLLSHCDGSLFQLLPLDERDLPGVAELLIQYRDQRLDLADAVLLHLANREGIEQVFTIDRRHFSVFRTAGGSALTLLP